jgi:hypothetical protein
LEGNMNVFARHNVTAAFALVITLILSGVVSVSAECNLVGTPVTQSGAIQAGDTAQTSRLFRDGRGWTCLFNRPVTTSAGSFLSDSYTYTNTTGGPICVFVELDATGCGVATNQIGIAAYSTYNPASIATGVIGDPGLSTGGSFGINMTFPVAMGASYTIVVHNINSGTFCTSYTFKKYETNNCRNAGYDRANDGSADLAVFRPSTGDWFSTTTGGAISATHFGNATDTPAPGDFSGDESTDTAVFRAATGTWYTDPAAGDFGAKNWGAVGDVPVQGDFDRDFTTDVAVYRATGNTWFVLRSEDSTWMQFTFGTAGDKPAPADFDGDGKTDPAMWRPSNGLWNIISSAGKYNSVQQILWGTTNDIPVPADYDGDGKSDVAVWRPSDGVWYIFRSSLTTGQAQFIGWGLSGDKPQPADYDGDRKADIAVFRPSDNNWYIQRSTAGFFAAPWGATGDVPVSSPNPNTNQ